MWKPDFGWTVHLHGLRLHGIALQGPAPGTVVDPVAPDDLRRVAVRGAREWLTPYLQDPASMHLGERAFVVLTACRILYTLDSGEIASKPAAGVWARERLDRAWTDIIDSALTWRKHHSDDSSIPLSDTIAFIRVVQNQVEQWDGPAGRR
jgi:hypothetical protein